MFYLKKRLLINVCFDLTLQSETNSEANGNEEDIHIINNIAYADGCLPYMHQRAGQ